MATEEMENNEMIMQPGTNEGAPSQLNMGETVVEPHHNPSE